MRQEILENLHQSHMGIPKTKARAREIVYWPKVNQHIEMLIFFSQLDYFEQA